MKTEKSTKTHWKRLTGANYLGAWDFEEKEERVLTIEKIQQEEVMNGDGKKEPCVVAYFPGLKPMILNKTNMKAITKATGTAFIEEWTGQSITVFTAKVRAFGDTVDALRVKPTKPKAKKKPEISPERFEKALEQIKVGKFDPNKLVTQFDLTDAQKHAIDNLNSEDNGSK